MDKKRCLWVIENDSLYEKYHDEEWGVPVKDERALFECLVLEGMQAGLSWRLILGRREDMRRAFHDFEPKKCAELTEDDVDSIMEMPGVIRYRKKVEMVRQNARAFLKVQKERGSFSDFIWSFVKGDPIAGNWKSMEDVPCESALSKEMAKELKKWGFTFVGSKTLYSFAQAVGLVNDHTMDCFACLH